MPSDDPWSGAGEHTRKEVREIFARHRAARGAAGEGGEAVGRRASLPGFLGLPARGWRGLSGPGKLAVSALGLALAVLIALLVPPALETAGENQATDRRLRAANLESIRQELLASQRPRRAVLEFDAGPAAALAAAVGQDAARRVARGELEGPLGETTCQPVQRTDVDPRAPVFTCLVEQGSRGEYRGRDLVSGYRFRGRVELAGGRAAWCKENPRPLHPDQEEFVVVPLSKACTG
jgi:hypothetical protein